MALEGEAEATLQVRPYHNKPTLGITLPQGALGAQQQQRGDRI